MKKPIEQTIEALLRHPGVWDETKESLRDMLADHQAGRLDPDDARYIEALHQKLDGGAAKAVTSHDRGSRASTSTIAKAGPPANDTAPAFASQRPMDSAAGLVALIKSDIEALVMPSTMGDRSEAEQQLRREILGALESSLQDLADKLPGDGQG